MKHRLQTLLKHKLQWLALLTALLGVSQGVWAGTSVTIYMHDDLSWNTYNIYYWGGECSNCPGWPGTAMEAVSGQSGWYKIDLNFTPREIIFNNGSGTQTEDITLNSSQPCYSNKKSSGTYETTCPSSCTPPTFTAPDATSWCDGSPGTLTVSTKTSGSTIQWWESESSSTPLSSGDSYTPASFTATTTYYISATKDDCPSARQSVTVTKIALPTLSLGLSPSTVYPWDVATITATTTCTESTLVWKLYQGESLITTGAGSGSTYTFGKTSNTVYTLKGISSSGSASSVTYTVKVDGNNGTCNAAQATQNVTISAAASEDCGD